MIAGAIKPSRGSVLLNGTNVAGWPSHKIARRGLARTFQQSSEFAGMTVTENLLTAGTGSAETRCAARCSAAATGAPSRKA